MNDHAPASAKNESPPAAAPEASAPSNPSVPSAPSAASTLPPLAAASADGHGKPLRPRGFAGFARRWAGPALLVGLCVFFAATTPEFRTVDNVLTILLDASPFALMATGLTLVVVAGAIDLSLGATAVCAGVVAGLAFKAGYPDWFAFAAAALVGLAAGAVNGLLIGWLRLPSFATTLALGLILAGAAWKLTDGRPVIDDIPREFSRLGAGTILRGTDHFTLDYEVFMPINPGAYVPLEAEIIPGFRGIPYPAALAAGLAAIFAIFLRYTRMGRRFFSVGRDAAEAGREGAGQRAGRVLFMGFAAGGLTAAAAGMVTMSRLGEVRPDAGLEYGFYAIAAVLIGGASPRGGWATIGGALAGALVLGVLTNGLHWMSAPEYVQPMLIGLGLALAASLDRPPASVRLAKNKNK